MAHRKNKASRKRTQKKAGHSFCVLDQFTETDLEFWAAHSAQVQMCHDAFFFDLERQRVQKYDALCSVLRDVGPTSVPLDHWVRVVDYQWCLQPLSSAGSLKGVGGRFNIGRELTRVRRQEFPALYIADSIETAFKERFGGQLTQSVDGLSLQEFALRTPGSFATFLLRGHVDLVFDLRNEAALQGFVDIIKTFTLSKDTVRFIQKNKLNLPHIIRTSSELMDWILAAPADWRRSPQMFSSPAVPQIFGRFLRDAGFEGVIYPSQKGGSLCMAVFPENFRGGNSRIEVVGAPADGAICTVLHKDDHCIATL